MSDEDDVAKAGEETEELSFEELFEANPITPTHGFMPGDTVSGEVVKISGDSIFVDLGSKSEGVVDTAEFLDKEGELTVKVGERLELKVAAVSDAVYLSKGLKVKGAQALEMLRDAWQGGIPVEGRVDGVNKGGLEVAISGVRAFCPVSQIDLGYCENPEQHVGSRYNFRIMEFKERGRNIIVSRRVLLEEEREKMARQVLETLKPGEEREGTVTRLMNYGAFVDIGGVEGMVHVSEMAHYRLNHPSDLLEVGQQVRVQVTQCEAGPDGRPRISFSMKALEPTPWDKGLGFGEGDVVRGKVTRLMDFGAFVELYPGVEGLVHVSEISYERIPHPQRVLEQGQEVEVRVLTIDRERQRLSLSIKEAQAISPSDREQAGSEPVEAVLEKGARLDGVVEKVSPGGLSVRLPSAGPGVRGFLPQQELGLEKKEEIKKRFPPGTAIQVAVIAIEAEGKIRLSRKALLDQEDQGAYRAYMKQGQRSGKMATLGDLFKDLKLPESKE